MDPCLDEEKVTQQALKGSRSMLLMEDFKVDDKVTLCTIPMLYSSKVIFPAGQISHYYYTLKC